MARDTSKDAALTFAKEDEHLPGHAGHRHSKVVKDAAPPSFKAAPIGETNEESGDDMTPGVLL